jgi:hypothetical protein
MVNNEEGCDAKHCRVADVSSSARRNSNLQDLRDRMCSNTLAAQSLLLRLSLVAARRML